MATSIFKNLDENDKVTQKTLLHESIPITGSLLSGSYGTFPNDTNVKFYSHGYFQSVYDYPYASSSANHIFDITYGHKEGSVPAPTASSQEKEIKHAIYSQMSQLLFGYDATGSAIPINVSGSLSPTSADWIANPLFINFSRLLVKDEIKKGSFELKIATSGSSCGSASMDNVATIGDYAATGNTVSFIDNSPVGEYGILYTGAVENNRERGLVFYQAGIAVLDLDRFFVDDNEFRFTSGTYGYRRIADSIISSSVDDIGDAVRRRIFNISFRNTTELNSTVYFCRLNHNEFNYSSNPTYVTASKLRVKDKNEDSPISYVTTVGLYSEDNELLAVGKLSEPLKKTAADELTIRVRTDF